jgi:hypothetical protein
MEKTARKTKNDRPTYHTADCGIGSDIGRCAGFYDPQTSRSQLYRMLPVSQRENTVVFGIAVKKHLQMLWLWRIGFARVVCDEARKYDLSRGS